MIRWPNMVFGVCAAVLALLGPALSQDKVRFGTN